MIGFTTFLEKLADRFPHYLSIILSRWFVNKIVQLDAVEARRVLEHGKACVVCANHSWYLNNFLSTDTLFLVLQKSSVSLPTMAIGAYNLEMIEKHAEDKTGVASGLGVKVGSSSKVILTLQGYPYLTHHFPYSY